MFLLLVWGTIAVCVFMAAKAYFSTRDVFHPALLLVGLCLFIYGYMPLSLANNHTLFSYVTDSQAEFCQALALLGISALLLGCFKGSSGVGTAHPVASATYSWQI